MTANSSDENNGPHLFFDFCALSRSEMIQCSESNNASPVLESVSPHHPTSADILKLAQMTLMEHLAAVLFLTFGVPSGVFTIPLACIGLGALVGGTVIQSLLILFVLLLPLVFLPQSFVRSRLHCWIAVQLAKYFSFRLLFEEPAHATTRNMTMADMKGSSGTGCECTPAVHGTTETFGGHANADSSPLPEGHPHGRPQILVAPPHGVFPYGGLLSMMAWPCYTNGHGFRSLAASAAVNLPIFKQILVSIGVIDASRASARRALESYPYTIGIPTGGVAEVFETTADDECILLRERIGLIKLAIRTGADLIPCYMFGHTKLLSCWSGHGMPGARSVLEKISRRLGVALVLPYGRYGLPIPRRIPIFAVAGRAIPTVHLQKEEPTDAEIREIQEKLIATMQALFDRHKHLYGWQEKQLVIK
jgi:Diacylglycerol acyltransferase